MKKSISLFTAAVMSLSLVGSFVRADEVTSAAKEINLTNTSDIQNMDYVTTSKTSDHTFNANFVNGLLETDRFGNLQPAIAESYEHNEDSTVWTFHLRSDVKWFTHEGEEYGLVTAEDFVTGVRHGAEFNSELTWLLEGTLKGYSEFRKSDFSDEEFEKVGVKALDDQTLEFTLENPTPYFATMTNYAVFYPIKKEFLESKGEGCKLGSPDRDNCDFGTVGFDTILYNGPYFLTENNTKSKIVIEKNEGYYDAEHVYIDKINFIYDNGEDPYSVIKGFEQGVYSQAGLSPSWEDYSSYLEKYKDNVYFSSPNNYVFGMILNFNRQKFDLTNYADDETEREKTHKALLNENFRKALRAANDAKTTMSTSMPEELAEATTRTIHNFPGAGTTSDGKSYYELVNEEYKTLTGEDRDLSDGKQPFLSKEEALKYIEEAKKEGVEFPVHLDMLVPETSDRLVKQGQSMKKSISDNTDGQIIIELVLKDLDTVQAVAYRESDPAKMDYDISTFSGWGPDYGDPKSFVDTWSTTTGSYMERSGLGLVDSNGDVLDKEIKDQVGLSEYEELYRAADKINDDMDARYRAFAKADALLLAKCFYIPSQMQARYQLVSKYVPFSLQYSDYGMTSYKFLRTQEDLVTTEQHAQARTEWEAGKK